MNKLVVTTKSGSIYVVDVEKNTISGGMFGQQIVSCKIDGYIMIGASMRGVAFFNHEWGMLTTSTVEKITRA